MMEKRKVTAGSFFSCLVILMMTFGVVMMAGSLKRVYAAGNVEINEANFPDANFRAVISGPDYDRDGNGILDENEIALTINIYCEGMGISSLQGVGYFSALQGLWCKDNAISSLDVSANKDLHGLWCSGNPLTTLDLSGNPVLEWVYCYDCNLTVLNVSGNPIMSYIECNSNPLTSLDVSHNPQLEHLMCGSCELTSLDLSNNPKLTHLDAFRNHLTSLDVSRCSKMKRLDIWDNAGLGSIDVSNCPGLQYYNCANNDAGSVDVTHNPELQKLICSYNHIQNLDVTHNPKLVYLDCACNQIGALELSNNPDLQFLQAFTNKITTLNIGNNPILVKTYEGGTKKNESNVGRCHSWTIDYGGDSSTGGDNIFFLCVDDSVSLKKDGTAKATKKEYADDNEPLSKDQISREEALYILYALEGSPDVSGLKTRFTDVKKDSWYEAAVLWGEKNSMCTGYPDFAADTFGVGKALRRQDMAFMLMRYSELKNLKRAIDFGRTDDYLDYYEIDNYAWEAVTWAVTWNIMEGSGGATKSEQKINPHAKVTRAEFEATYNKMMAVNEKKAVSSFPVPDKGEESDVEVTSEEEEKTKEETVVSSEKTSPEEISGAVSEESKDVPEIIKSEVELFGFSYVGVIFLIMLFVPNIIWAKNKPEGYDEFCQNENRILLIFERIGEVCACAIVFFKGCNVRIGTPWIAWLIVSCILMVLYECYWVRYFRSKKTMADMYSSFAGFPVAGASLPVVALFFLGVYALNPFIIATSVILGIGHIGIHLNHRKEALAAMSEAV